MRALIAAAGIAGALAFVGAPAFAQSNCAALCAVQCAKPMSIPDRWDDSTPIPGYIGVPNWRNNNAYDAEALTNDVNGNGLYDPGDTFVDGNGNGVFDAEAYGPNTTGYVTGPYSMSPSGDLGLELTLKANNGTRPSPGLYLAFDLPAVNRGVPVATGDAFRDNLAACNPSLVGPDDHLQVEASNMVGPANQGLRDLIAQDTGAYWDDISQSVQGSKFAQSPRIVFIPVHDPRIPINSGRNFLVVTKVVAFFMEQMEGNAEVRGRFLRAMGAGEACAGGGDSFIVECPTPAQVTSWGHVKDLYR